MHLQPKTGTPAPFGVKNRYSLQFTVFGLATLHQNRPPGENLSVLDALQRET